MARRASKTDANQQELVAQLRAKGYSVSSLAMCGDGIPDLLVGFRGLNLVIEVKDPGKAPSRRGLTPAQVHWHANWQGQVATVHDLQEFEEVLAKHLERYG